MSLAQLIIWVIPISYRIYKLEATVYPLIYKKLGIISE